jgi:glycosyltransferase involved in cell wall biosynthesis
MPHEGGGVLDRRLVMTVLRQGDALIVHSEQDRRRLHVLLPQAEVRKALIPTYAELADQRGPDAAGTTPTDLKHELALPTDRPILLFFGFVRPYKGLEYLVQSLPLVLEQIAVHALVVGEFWSSPEFYQRYAREFGVEQAITFVNRYVPNEELPPYFDLADVVVLPYVSATQSAVVQLAFGFGKPVITTRVGGLHEVVQDGVNGLVVPPQDEVALANAIVRYFVEGLQGRLAQNICDERRDNTFSWSSLVGEIERLAADLSTR